jgi:DNA polymerase delta subunit 2
MVEALRELDAWLLRIVVAGCPVDIMPGKSDPTSANWPQRALHHSLVQHTSRVAAADHGGNNKSLFYRAPNPYVCRHAGQWVVGTDGTNVQDLVQRLKFTPSELSSSSYSPELLAMEKNIQWAHLCPNGPSSVPTVPHAEKDPMVLEQEEQPRLYFAGNCQEFATKMMTLSTAAAAGSNSVVSTRLVCVPAFSETGQAVLVNLETMDVQVLKFEE